jgi:hypothetical protein
MSNASYLNNAAGVKTKTISGVSLKAFQNTKLLLNFLTLPPTLYDKIEPKNIVNYNQFNCYKYTFTGAINRTSSQTMVFNNLQLNQIPQKIIICIRSKFDNI